MHCKNTSVYSRMLSDRGYVGRYFGTGAPLRKGGSAQNPGQRVDRYRNRASRWHPGIFSGEGRRISRGSGEPIEGTDEHSLARTHFAKPYGWRSLRNPGSHSAGQIVSLRLSTQTKRHLLDAFTLWPSGTS